MRQSSRDLLDLMRDLGEITSDIAEITHYPVWITSDFHKITRDPY
jgi:hypothetical protein